MRPADKATADSRSVQSFAIIINTGHGNFDIGRFHTHELEMDYPSKTGQCTVPSPPPQTTLLRFFLRGVGGSTQTI